MDDGSDLYWNEPDPMAYVPRPLESDEPPRAHTIGLSDILDFESRQREEWFSKQKEFAARPQTTVEAVVLKFGPDELFFCEIRNEIGKMISVEMTGNFRVDAENLLVESLGHINCVTFDNLSTSAVKIFYLFDDDGCFSLNEMKKAADIRASGVITRITLSTKGSYMLLPA